MTFEHAVALSFVQGLSRIGLTERLEQDDPELIELAEPYLKTAENAGHTAAAAGIHAIPWNAADFPALLRTLPDCPPALWCRGDLRVFASIAVAIVGSRAATAVAVEIGQSMAADLARAGVTVVSGLARGVDSAAHRGAVAHGTTIAVLGSGPDWIYPAQHAALANDIAVAGLVVSEYPPGTPPLPFHFPQRNRLISGLSRAVVVIEAAEESGSLITASCALEQGREVMVVPGNALSGRNRGGHALIRDGARIVESAADVLAELGLDVRRGGSASATARGPGGAADPVVAAMDEGEPYDLDALTAMVGMPGPQLLARLLELEIAGIVRRVDGGRFLRPRRPC